MGYYKNVGNHNDYCRRGKYMAYTRLISHGANLFLCNYHSRLALIRMANDHSSPLQFQSTW